MSRNARPEGRIAVIRGSATASLAAILIVASSAVAVGNEPSADPLSNEPAGSGRKMTLGVSMAGNRSLATFDEFAASAGRAPAIWSIWSDWGGATGPFPNTTLLDGLATRGAVPLVIWQPVDPTNLKSQAYRYRRILEGRHDAYIRGWAQAAADWGKPILLRFAHEMDGHWFPWGVRRFDNTPTRFINAWRYVWNIFRGPDGVGATNVKFVWSPTAPCRTCISFESIYPGDRYVDYAAFTKFNWGTPKPWKSMVSLYKAPMKAIAQVTSKPVIAAETGSSAKGGDKAAWIRDGYPGVYVAYPRLTAVVYFNLDMRHVDQPNWLINKPAAALDAYRAILARSRFQGSIN